MVVDPQAESSGATPPTNVVVKAAKQEAKFFDQAKAEYDLKLRDHDLKKQSHDIGRIGAFFGASWTPPMYVAAFVAAVSLLALIGLAFKGDGNFTDTQKSLATLVSTAMAFLWGKGDKR